MTALGVDMTDREPVTGWEAVKVQGRPVPVHIARLDEALAEAWRRHGEEADAQFGKDDWKDVDHALIEELVRAAEHIEAQRREAYLEWQRNYTAWLDGKWPVHVYTVALTEEAGTITQEIPQFALQPSGDG